MQKHTYEDILMKQSNFEILKEIKSINEYPKHYNYEEYKQSTDSLLNQIENNTLEILLDELLVKHEI
jgi:hypothetical protein